MPSIAIMTSHARFPWLRQIEGGGDMIGAWRFTLDRIDPDCALLVVYDEPRQQFVTTLPPERRMAVLSEPPGIKVYRRGYLDQFGLLHGPIHGEGAAERTTISHPALPWFYGVGFEPGGLVANETVDTLLAMPPPQKQCAISLVISNKVQTPKHRARVAFAEDLKRRLGDRVMIFGRGFQPLQDKAEVIRPYAYHLVLENNDIDHFWTEKTADAYLGWALPVFSGCANLGVHFPEGSFVPIDITDPSRAIGTIAQLLDDNPYPAFVPAIAEARARLMREHNLFPILARIAEERGFAAPFVPVSGSIRTNMAFRSFNGVRTAFRQAGRQFKTLFRPQKGASQ